MERIIILSDQPERSKALVSLLNDLFPECDVSIVSRKPNAEDQREGRHVPSDEPPVSRAHIRD